MEYLETDHVRPSADGESVIYLDQSLLPGMEEWKKCSEIREMYDAIKRLEVRGAPCIGIFAGYCMAVRAALLAKKEGNAAGLLSELKKEAEYLNSSRPTAVNLSYVIGLMISRAENALAGDGSISPKNLSELLMKEAERVHLEDIDMCAKIAENGLSLIEDGYGILTHCNAGPLATSRLGTALGPILLGKSRGMEFHVYADETRPLLQGARLTSYELSKAGVDVTLICDNMAASIMKQGRIQACFVGCDRVAANGDTANKIGTLGVAVMAKHFGIPFYVLGPKSSIDISCGSGADIVIEERSPEEVKLGYFSKPSAPGSVRCYNPSFDVTDHELITAIITDGGILRPPFHQSIGSLFNE
ncbi:MAG: S-methyl-5-thioribose-1-phosphate isomerase [Lachnospiraceae bacterium]|nr:S-methyl-5-thioribose-1-phosphate isomerase [Lachnospiraceae bacterium]